MRPALLVAVIAALGGPADAETRPRPGLSLAHGSFSIGGGMTVATELRRTAQGGTPLRLHLPVRVVYRSTTTTGAGVIRLRPSGGQDRPQPMRRDGGSNGRNSTTDCRTGAG